MNFQQKRSLKSKRALKCGLFINATFTTTYYTLNLQYKLTRLNLTLRVHLVE